MFQIIEFTLNTINRFVLSRSTKNILGQKNLIFGPKFLEFFSRSDSDEDEEDFDELEDMAEQQEAEEV